MKALQRTLRSLLLPISITLIAFIASILKKELPLAYVILAPTITYSLLVIGMLLSIWFNRSRSFFLLIIISLTLFFLVDFNPTLLDYDQYIHILYPFMSILLPINILIFSFHKEKGIFSQWGFLRFGIIVFQIFFIASNLIYRNDELIRGIGVRILPWDLSIFTPLPQLSILFFLVSLLIIVWKKKAWTTNLDKAFFGVTILLAFSLHYLGDSLAIRIYITFAAILFIIALIQDAYRMAYMDELTGIPGRRALKEELMKLTSTYTIAMLDVDHFKKFNDTHGHDVGDEVLKLVASCLRDVNGGGKAYRYGGEEFTILFPNKKLVEAIPHLEELRERLSKTGLVKNRSKQNSNSNTNGKKATLYITASIGVAENSEKHNTPDDVIVAADKALYRAKKKGRNQVSK